MRAADRAWIALAAGVLAYEILAPDGEMLSHGVDRYLEDHPYITWAAISMTAAHLLNVLPQVLDPWHWGLSWKKLLRG